MTAAEATADNIRQEKGSRQARKAVLAGCIGQFVESFDYGVYGYLSVVLATLFFPPGSGFALAGVFVGFALGFLVRPLGGLIFGKIGDTYGRRDTLAISIVMMAICTVLVGCLPTYASIGIAAPLLLFTLRILQGISVGGEYAGAVSYIVEFGPENRRAFYASWVSFSVWFALLAGASVGFLLQNFMPEQALLSWGWRLPFLLGGAVGMFGLYLRLRLEDSPEFRAMTREQGGVEHAPIKEAFVSYWKPILIFISFAVTNAIASYTFATYVPAYLQTEVGLSPGAALGTNALATLVLALCVPFAGLLNDRVGRKPMLLTACVLFTLFTIPAFLIITAGGVANALIGQLLYVVSVFFITVTLTVCMPEMFPTKVRYSASAISFNVSFGIFGGLAPLISDRFVSAGVQLFPAYFLTGSAVISFVLVFLFFRETFRTPLSEVGSLYTTDRPARQPATGGAR